jgi:hypothetical protein
MLAEQHDRLRRPLYDGAAPHAALLAHVYMACQLTRREVCRPAASVFCSRSSRRRQFPRLKRILVLDFAGSQCADLARDKLFFEDDSLTIVDVYNPRLLDDHFAKSGCAISNTVPDGADARQYLTVVQQTLAATADLCRQVE